jgi:polysaccharide export outer membrane protein
MVPGSNINPDNPSGDINTGFFKNDNAVWFPGLFENRRDEISEEDVTELFSVQPITAELLAEHRELTMPISTRESVPAAMSAETMSQIDSYEYKIGNGDVLSVTVYEHPELTIPAGGQRTAAESGNIVDNDGTLFYPYIGQVHVSGLTVTEIRETVATRLAEYITDPQVAVRVNSFNSQRMYVTGRVGQPGSQRISNVPLTVLDAISQAGGLSDSANWHEVLLSRNGQETRLSVYEMLNNGRLGQNLLLQHGDVLHVPDVGEQKVFVLGELNRVNTIAMGNLRMSLTEALTQSGGLNQVTSNASGIFVIRQTKELAAADAKLATIYQLDVRNALNFAIGTRFMLQPTDIVYVTTAPVTRWNRVISQLLPSLNALITADRVSGL